MVRKIELFRPYVSRRARQNAARTLGSKWIGEGPQVKEFERVFAARFGFASNQVAAVNSGTSALELAYHLADLGSEDEVITPVLTCTATNIPLLRRGVKIVFADIDRDYNVDVMDVWSKITPRTKAIVFVHYGGNNRGLRQLLEDERSSRLIIIEDAAHAVGSHFWGKADFTAISFQAIKTLTTADGGMLVCSSAEACTKAKRLRWFGYDRDRKLEGQYAEPEFPGYRYTMTDVTASVGLGNLTTIDKVLSHRYRLAKEYNELNLPIQAHTWLATGTFSRREHIEEVLRRAEIETGQVHFRNDIYRIFGGRRQRLPMMNELEEKYLVLPMHMGVRVRDVKRICQIIRDAI